MTGVNGAVSGEPRPYGRQPVALRELSESIAYQLERELRAAGAVESAHLFVKAFGCALAMNATAGRTTPTPTFGSRRY